MILDRVSILSLAFQITIITTAIFTGFGALNGKQASKSMVAGCPYPKSQYRRAFKTRAKLDIKKRPNHSHGTLGSRWQNNPRYYCSGIANIVQKRNMADTCGDVRQMYRTIVLLVALTLIMVFSIAGCQTVQGLGRDITLLGETAQDIVD